MRSPSLAKIGSIQRPLRSHSRVMEFTCSTTRTRKPSFEAKICTHIWRTCTRTALGTASCSFPNTTPSKSGPVTNGGPRKGE
uniref:Uncharacterized protein n=1 Tax=Kuenenia stuttgartiensis TaxID=174633 RepID=Q1Q556_KUEST|nr:unknown protein [Candidatus Kuenenia stuttgartiensis]